MGKFNERIRALAEYAPKGGTLVDIGTDHAYLPILLHKDEVCASYILTDVKAGPLEKARNSVTKSFGYIPDVFDFRLGDGLITLSPGEADVCVIAGMGGESIAAILEESPEIADSIELFILQPRTKIEYLCSFLPENGYIIEKQRSAMERGRKCEILIVRKVT